MKGSALEFIKSKYNLDDIDIMLFTDSYNNTPVEVLSEDLSIDSAAIYEIAACLGLIDNNDKGKAIKPRYEKLLSNDELKEFDRVYPFLSNAFLSELFEISLRAVHRYGYNGRLKKDSHIVKINNQTVSRLKKSGRSIGKDTMAEFLQLNSDVDNRKRKITDLKEREKSKLIMLFPETSNKDLAALFNIDEKALINFAFSKGLKKSREYISRKMSLGWKTRKSKLNNKLIK